MSSAAVSRSFKQEKKGSFFKLIESFAVELGTLKKEMGHRSEPKAAPSSSEPLESLDEDVGGLFLRGSPCSGLCSGSSSPLRTGLEGYSGLRDSGYAGSLHRKLTVLERLIRTHSVWLQLGLNQQGALKILKNQPPGTFVVRRSSSQQRKVLCVKMDSDSDPVQDFAVKESQFSFSLEGSGLSFVDLFRLVAFCCISRDVLPFTLKLPEPITSAQTSADLDQISKQGPGFWDAQSVCKRKSSSFSAPDRPPPPTNRTSSISTISTISSPQIHPQIKTRMPSELERCQSNGALCFINPLFIKVHQEDANRIGTTPDGDSEQPQKHQPLESDGDAKPEDSNIEKSSPENANFQRSPPPPRPPPPRFTKSGSSRLTRTRSMPEKVPWIVGPKEKSEDRKSKDGSLLSRLGSSLSISPSTSPPRRILNISSPITIPKPSLSLSLASFSSSPRRGFKMSPSSSSQEDAQCHLAMEDHVIEQALRRARLQRSEACKEEEVQDDAKENEEEKSVREGGQRLSDMSLSTDSSDSLDFSQQSFFFPPLHDPNPPTLEEINTHLPLSLPPYSSMEDDDDDDDEDYEEDYGVGLESDQEQDQDLTMVPPGHRTKRRTSASAVVIQKALKGQLRKMSGVFNSLLTPEKRAIRKVLELSRDKTTYFGGLVQDFLGYMADQGQEQGLGFDSGSELLQTVRQFLTQMKSYLRQSSELEPPIESLIPEDQIASREPRFGPVLVLSKVNLGSRDAVRDRVLEKAMHKCVLKPLKPVISDALQESMIRSGAWAELRENMSLAKTKPPAEIGVSDALPPDAVAIEKIKQKFQAMCKLYSPDKKVGRLLQVCKLIYTIMEDNSGRLFGADDFLPMLTFVLAQCDMPQLDNEILYMMELLDPTLLNGEGGYYLTSAYGAMSLIKNFQEEQAARVLSSQTRDTLHQWHRRRTMQRTAPSIDDFQNYLRVALQEQDSGCTAKTLSVHPQGTVEEVCSLCAVKFAVAEPEKYRLFLITEGSSQQLAPDTHPQKIKAELHSRDQPDNFHFVYRRTDFNAPSNQANDANANPTKTIPDQENNLSPRLSLSLPQGNIHSVSI